MRRNRQISDGAYGHNGARTVCHLHGRVTCNYGFKGHVLKYHNVLKIYHNSFSRIPDVSFRGTELHHNAASLLLIFFPSRPPWCLSCSDIKTPHYTTHRQSSKLHGRGKLIPHQSAARLPWDGPCEAYNTSLGGDVITNQVKFVQSMRFKETRENDRGLIICEEDQHFNPRKKKQNNNDNMWESAEMRHAA